MSRTVTSRQPIEGTIVAPTPREQKWRKERAREITGLIQMHLDSLHILRELITEAFTTRVWETLGYSSWDAYTEAEFRSMKTLDRDDQRALNVVLQLEEGMSARAAASATGSHPGTARKDAREELGSGSPVGSPQPPAAPPQRRVGADGKSRPASRPRPEKAPRARPEPTPPDINVFAGNATRMIRRFISESETSKQLDELSPYHGKLHPAVAGEVASAMHDLGIWAARYETLFGGAPA